MLSLEDVGDPKKVRRLETTTKLVHQPVPARTPKHIKDWLRRYDLVLECIADYPSGLHRKAIIEKWVKLKIAGSWTGACQHHSHPLHQLQPLHNADGHKGVDWSDPNNPPKEGLELLAASFHLDKLGAAGALIAPFWNFDTIKQFEVTAESCGVREAGQGRPNRSLTALVNIYRNDKYEIILRLPSYKSWNKAGSKWARQLTLRNEHVQSRKIDEFRSETRTWDERTKYYSHKKTVDKKSGVDYTETKIGQMTGKDQYKATAEKVGVNGFEKDPKTGKQVLDPTTGKPIPKVLLQQEELVHDREGFLVHKANGTVRRDSTEEITKHMLEDITPELGVFAIFRHNEREIDFSKIINGIVAAKEALDLILHNMKDYFPQVGLIWNVSFEFLEGGIAGVWGNTYDEAHARGPRYLAVESYYEISVNLCLYKLAISIGFGVSAPGPKFVGIQAWDFFAGVEGTLTSSAELRFLFKSDSPQKAKFEGPTTLDLHAGVRVTVVGITFMAFIGVAGGFTVDGELAFGFDHPPELSACLKMQETYWYTECTKHSGETEKTKHKLLPEKDLLKGTFPEALHTSAGHAP
jgi:hypothetical protein